MAFRGDLEALVLGVLQEGPLHGYEIAKRIREKSDALIRIGEGQLYPCLHRLEQSGFIQAEWLLQEGKPSRKVYSLTESGGSEVEERRRTWEKFAAGVNSVLAPPKPARGQG